METIASIRTKAREGQPVEAEAGCQVEHVATKSTRDGKPYLDVALVDATDRFSLRVWSDHPSFDRISDFERGVFVAVGGEFALGAFGLEAKRWRIRKLDPPEVEALVSGPAELRERQDRDYADIGALVVSLSDPRLRGLCALFLEEMGPRFRRSAAARNYHHARRGGLVEHEAQMMRCADAVARIYPALNRDLLLAGTLFHDCGKLWENAVEEAGFAMPFTLPGELMGHITIGIELVNALWRKLLASEAATGWAGLEPAAEEVRLHLLHLIASHHGELEFGSPVVPKTPEAAALHYIDNLDAKLEMFAGGYGSAAELAPGILERVRPLPGNLVRPLPVVPGNADGLPADA